MGLTNNDIFKKLRVAHKLRDDQIVEMLAAVSLYGFLNRWNDSMATDLEEAPKSLGDEVLTKGGWTGGRHV